MTAVEWLYNHLFPKQLDGFSDEEWNKIDLAFKQVKEIEKKQIVDAVDEAIERMSVLENFKTLKNGEQYYNETFIQLNEG
jgi:hypothetical protein